MGGNQYTTHFFSPRCSVGIHDDFDVFIAASKRQYNKNSKKKCSFHHLAEFKGCHRSHGSALSSQSARGFLGRAQRER
jgi:hypothetical protein